MFLTFLCSNPPSIHTLPPHIWECVCVEQESLFNGRDRGPWGLSSPTAEGFRGKAGGCSVNSSGLNNACVPSAPDPPTTNIRSGRKRMIKGDKRVCVCVWDLCLTNTHTHIHTVKMGLRGLERPAVFCAFLLLHFHTTASFAEAALRLINSQTIWQMLSTVSGCVPSSNEAFSPGANKLYPTKLWQWICEYLKSKQERNRAFTPSSFTLPINNEEFKKKQHPPWVTQKIPTLEAACATWCSDQKG